MSIAEAHLSHTQNKNKLLHTSDSDITITLYGAYIFEYKTNALFTIWLSCNVNSVSGSHPMRGLRAVAICDFQLISVLRYLRTLTGSALYTALFEA